MVDTGIQTGIANIVVAGKVPIATHHKIETVANCYPGRLVTKGTTVQDIKVCTNLLKPKGWLGFEDTALNYRPADKDTIYVVNDHAAVIRGGGFVIEASLAAGFNVTQDDKVCNWTAGQVAGPAMPADGGVWIGIPFSKNASEADTTVDLPTGAMVVNAIVQVVTAAGSSTIDVGLLSSETGGDADGFIDGASCAATGLVALDSVDATAATMTLGALLTQQVTTGTGFFVNEKVEPGYVVGSTAVSVSYTTSSHTVAGFIWLQLLHPGLQIVGTAEASVDATSAAADLLVRSDI